MDENQPKGRRPRKADAPAGPDNAPSNADDAASQQSRTRRPRRKAAAPKATSANTAAEGPQRPPVETEPIAVGDAGQAPTVPADGPKRRSRGGRRRKPKAEAIEGAGAEAGKGPVDATADGTAEAKQVKGRAPGTQQSPAAETESGAEPGGETAKASPRPRRRRRKRQEEAATPQTRDASEATDAAPSSSAASAAAGSEAGESSGSSDAPLSESPGVDREAQESADAATAHKRRRRGSRGGRRVRAREARRAAAEADAAPGGSTEGAAAEVVATVATPPEPSRGIQTVPEASVEAPATDGETPPGDVDAPRRRRRGGRRGRRATGEMGGDQIAGESSPADEAGPVAAAPVGEQPEPAAKPKRRRRRGGKEAEEPAAAEQAAIAAEAPAGAPAESATQAPPEVEAKPKRRRRGRKAEAAAEPVAGAADQAAGDRAEPGAEAPAVAPAKEGAPAKTERGRRRDRRRPRAIVRIAEGAGAESELAAEVGRRRPEVTVEVPRRKVILITDDRSELRVALVEDGRLAEIYFERPDKRSYLGDIYRGKVENVLAGIDAAFVDFGLDKNGFLYVDEVRGEDGQRRGRRIGEALKQGQEVLVQVMKDPMGSKGARLTTKISLAGRYVVYVPGGSGVGVSRRLPQSERDRLRDLCQDLKTKNAGLIVRTAAEGEGIDAIKRDVRFLSRLWSRLKKKAETGPVPGLVHKEVDIALEVTRDLFNESVESLVVDSEKRRKEVVSFLDKVAPELVPRVHVHSGQEPLFEAYGIEQQIFKALERRVPLPSGGNIVIDHAEALTVIDVNSGRYTSGKGLEDTILKTNLEAAREVVRQLRLRDIGGIIIIDFIDMAHVRNRETVLATLEAELDTDRTKTYVVELSPLGLVEMTRQNTTDGARGILTRSCACCQGKARTLSEETVALSVERRLRVQSRRSGAKACLVELSAGVAERLSGRRLKELEKETGRRIFVEGSSALPVDSFKILAEGTAEHVQAQRIPVSEGQEVEVELEFSLTYSPRDAVGYVNGYMVIVEGGRPSLGERRKVKLTSASRTGATAVLASGRGGRGGGSA